MRVAMRVLLVLAAPGVVFGFLTRVPRLEFDWGSLDDGFTVSDPWRDVVAGLAVAALVAVVATIVTRVLYWLRFDADPRWRRAR
jgi:hypothetical protein